MEIMPFTRRFMHRFMKKETLVRCLLEKGNESYYATKFSLQTIGRLEEIDIGESRWPNKYPNGVVTYKIVSHTKDFANRKIQQRAVVVGVRAIGLIVKNIRFRRIRDTRKPADVEIYFTHDDPLFIKKPNTLAYAYLVPNNPELQPESKKIVFNDRHFWTVYGDSKPAHEIDPIHYTPDNPTRFRTEPLLHVFMHEFIHKLGFHHDNKEEDSIMWPWSKFQTHPNAFILHGRDITRLQNKYGVRKLPKSVLARMRRRRLARYDFRRF